MRTDEKIGEDAQAWAAFAAILREGTASLEESQLGNSAQRDIEIGKGSVK